MNKPRHHLDVPTEFFKGRRLFVPPKAREADEIERRKGQPKGTLIAEYQYRGLAMVAIMLGLMKQPDDIAFGAAVLPGSGIATARLSWGPRQDVMRNELSLARFDTPDPEQRPSSYMLRQLAIDGLTTATDKSYRLVNAQRQRKSSAIKAYQRQVARTTGHGVLNLACTGIGDQIAYGEIALDDVAAQELSWRQGQGALRQARDLAHDLGTMPSMAALADPDSDLSVFWRREGTNGAVAAYEQAYETMATAR